MLFWQTSRRKLSLGRPLVMAILNITPDSFSDGGKFLSADAAIEQAGRLIADGADILDIGGESTRPGGTRISAEEELGRVIPVIEAIAKRFDTPISIDTTRSLVAQRAAAAGAEIINDISGLRFDERIAIVAAEHKVGLVLMHSSGSFETMHQQQPAGNILREIADDFRRGIDAATAHGVRPESIVLDVGIGFGKTLDDNLKILANFGKIRDNFAAWPLMVGTSRKSFIGKILGGVPADERLAGSLATAAVAVWNGANIVRAHDVKATVDALQVVEAIRNER
jgi:dihydropteroate synthase